MGSWEIKIDLTDVWPEGDVYGDKFLAVRDAIVQRIRKSGWIGVGGYVRRLADTADMDAFNRVWARIYDAADRDRVFIHTTF